MTKRGNACVWSVIYVREAEWTDLQLNALVSRCCTVPPMFSVVPIKLSLEQEAAPSPRVRVKSEGKQRSYGFSSLCSGEEVSSVRPAFTKTLLCPLQQANVRNPAL